MPRLPPVTNTVRIAEACHVELKFDQHFFPVYALPESVTPEQEFYRLAREGLARRLEQHPERDTLDEAQYKDRLEFAIGRTCSADWVVRKGSRRATSVSTTWLPKAETPQTRAGEVEGATLSMKTLAASTDDC